jgi:IgGFc binding protein
MVCAALLVFAACGGSGNKSGFDDGSSGTSSGDGGDEGGGLFGDGGGLGGGDGASSGGFTGDPVTCDQATLSKSYIGCDYWPTVVANNVWSIFDFAAVVANAGQNPADITVTGPGGTNKKVTVQPQQLTTIYLPWVTDLKGPDTDQQGSATPMQASVLSVKGAYHLVSTSPVTVYQFNALEYKGQGGPPGKSWAACPGGPQNPFGLSCFSYSNDASLLLPSTAMTGNYRIAGPRGWSEGGQAVMGAYFAVTGTADGTNVKIRTSTAGTVLAGGTIAATAPGGTLSFTLNAGDVAEVVGPQGDTHDLSGSQVTADKPVQVITGIACVNMPEGAGTCDHVEESVFPAETLGKHYVVTVPTGPNGNAPGHVVRIFGNVDGTHLAYGGGAPCPNTVNAGQVIDCGVVSKDFEVTGDHEFSVASFMLGNTIVDPTGDQTAKGDPSQTQMIAVEQYRIKYIFLAPADYDVSYIDVVGPPDTQLTLDGTGATATFTPVGVNGLAVARIKLGAGQSGAHVITGNKAFGLQVMGYGAQTSYEYPGGLDLHAIAPPPPPVK